MIIFDKVELLTENRPHKCLITLFEKHKLNGRWEKNPNFVEASEFAEACADFELKSNYRQKMAGVWVYVLRAPYKYQDIPCIGKILPKLPTVKKNHRQKPVNYDDLVAEECFG